MHGHLSKRHRSTVDAPSDVHYEIYLKMAQNCSERERATWLDAFKLQNGPKIFPFRFGPFWGLNFKMAPNFKLAQTLKWLIKSENFVKINFDKASMSQNGQFWIFYIGKIITLDHLKFGAIFWSSNLKMAQNERKKFLGHFEVWMHIKLRGKWAACVAWVVESALPRYVEMDA